MSAHAKDGVKGKSGKRSQERYVVVKPDLHRGREKGKAGEISEVEKAEKIAESLRNPTEELRQRFREYIANH